MTRRKARRHVDSDTLDGCCDLDCDNGPELSDEDAPYVALFARQLGSDLEVADPTAVHLRAAEWRNLFPEPT